MVVVEIYIYLENLLVLYKKEKKNIPGAQDMSDASQAPFLVVFGYYGAGNGYHYFGGC
jgi:hypothetical protein